MNWLFLSIFAGLASNGFNVVNRLTLRNNGDATAYGWWFECLRTLFFILVIFFVGEPNFSIEMLFPLFAISLIELFSIYFLMKMHSYVELSISSVVSRSRMIWSPLLAYFIIGEKLSIFGYIGILIIFLGIILVTSPRKMRKDKGVKTALLFAFSSALLSIVVKNATDIASTEMIIIAYGVLPLITLPFLMKDGFKRIVGSMKTNFSYIFFAGFFNIISLYLMVEALSKAEASKVVGVYQAMTLFSVLYGILVLKEAQDWQKKILGVAIVVLGIVIMLVK